MKRILKPLVVMLVTAALVVGLLVALGAGLIALVTPGRPTIAQRTILTLDLSMDLTERAGGLDPAQALEDALTGYAPARAVPLHSLLRGLEGAATDPRIVGLYLYGSLTPRGYGSGYAALRELRDALARFKQAGKPVRAFLVTPTVRDFYLASVAASGGYWISANADRIFASSNTLTGSIGIFGLAPNVKELANQHGVTWDVVKTGRLADALGVSRPKTPEEMALLQKYIEEGYQAFLERVSTGRRMPREAVHEVAQGRVWAGGDALRLGLVDEIGGLESAIAYAARKAGLGQDWRLIGAPAKKSTAEALQEWLRGGKKPVAQAGIASRLASELSDELAWLMGLNDPLGCYALMPYTLRVK
jgi:signal peptide peptidase SppA